MPMLSLALAATLALNPDVSQDTIQQTICRKGYSSTVRPSTSYTNPIKYRLMRQEGIPESESSEWALRRLLAGGRLRKQIRAAYCD